MIIIVLSIILVNLLLSIDNIIPLVLIVEPLPTQKQRQIALFIGILAGAVLRFVFAAIASKLFSYGPVIYAISGVFLLFIGIQGLRKKDTQASATKKSVSLVNIILSIIVIDISLSIDNIAGIIAITQQLSFLFWGILLSAILLFGLSFSISKIVAKIKGLDIAAYIAIIFLGIKLLLWSRGYELSSYLTSAIIILICIVTISIVSFVHKPK